MIKADVFDTLGYEASPLDPCFFMKKETKPRSDPESDLDDGTDIPVFTTEPDDSSLCFAGLFVIVALYVDDSWVAGNWDSEVGRLKDRLKSCYECDKFEPPSWFLGLENRDQ